MAMAGQAVDFAMAAPVPMMMADSAGPPQISELAPVTHVRKLFPETWLWKSLETSYVNQTGLSMLELLTCLLC